MKINCNKEIYILPPCLLTGVDIGKNWLFSLIPITSPMDQNYSLLTKMTIPTLAHDRSKLRYNVSEVA